MRILIVSFFFTYSIINFLALFYPLKMNLHDDYLTYYWVFDPPTRLGSVIGQNKTWGWIQRVSQDSGDDTRSVDDAYDTHSGDDIIL